MKSLVINALEESRQALSQLLQHDESLSRISQAGKLLADSLAQGGRAFSCGNGGSMCDAMHFAEELTGRFRRDRRPLAATAIADPSHISCTANDFGYDEIFSRYIAAHGRSGDFLLAISTSGTSANVLRAAEVARQQGLTVVSLTGRPQSPLASLASLDICTPGPSGFADRVQELHIKCIHILIELCEYYLDAKGASDDE